MAPQLRGPKAREEPDLERQAAEAVELPGAFVGKLAVPVYASARVTLDVHGVHIRAPCYHRPVTCRPAPPLLLLLLCACSGACACGADGQLTIQIESPQNKAYDPLQDIRLSRFSLRVVEGASQRDTETLRGDGGELRMGDVPVGRAFDLRLAGKSGTGQMLGLGLLVDLEVPAEGKAVSVKFRKPIGLIPGSPGIEQLDTTATKGNTIHLSPRIGAAGAVDVATSPDGAWFAVIAGSELQIYSTSDARRWKTPPVRFKAPGIRVAVSPDSRYVVVCHDSGLITVVDMAALAEGKVITGEAKVTGQPGRVVFGRDRRLARVLVGTEGGCTLKSTVVELDLGTLGTRTLELGRPASDLAVDPRDGRVLVALPCDKRLGMLEGSAVKHTEAQVPDEARDLTLTDQYLVTFGTQKSGTQVEGVAALIDLNKSGFAVQRKSFILPQVITWLGSTGFWLVRDSTVIDDLVVSPDGQRALFLFSDKLHTIPSPNCAGDVKLTARGYMLVDLNVDMRLYWQMTKLSFDAPAGAACEGWIRQALRSGGVLASPEYEPGGAAMLFGGS